MTNPVGRPRTSSPSPEECIALGKELVNWLTEPTTEPRLIFQQWYSIKKKILRKEWKTLIQSPEFLPYYEQAQSILAIKCLNGKIKEGFAHRYLRLYDRDLIECEDEHAKFKASLSREGESGPIQKVVFEVNYNNDNNDSITVSPEALPTPDPESVEQWD